MTKHAKHCKPCDALSETIKSTPGPDPLSSAHKPFHPPLLVCDLDFTDLSGTRKDACDCPISRSVSRAWTHWASSRMRIVAPPLVAVSPDDVFVSPDDTFGHGRYEYLYELPSELRQFIKDFDRIGPNAAGSLMRMPYSFVLEQPRVYLRETAREVTAEQ